MPELAAKTDLLLLVQRWLAVAGGFADTHAARAKVSEELLRVGPRFDEGTPYRALARALRDAIDAPWGDAPEHRASVEQQFEAVLSLEKAAFEKQGETITDEDRQRWEKRADLM